MYAIVKNGQILNMIPNLATAFPGVVIPRVGTSEFATWKSNNSVVEVVYGVRKDDRFYFNSENAPTISGNVVQVTYTSTAQDLDDKTGMNPEDPKTVVMGLKSQWTSQIKDKAGKMLAETDWMVIRKVERDVAIPAEVVAKRAAIVAECNRLETAIAAAADVDALKAVVDGQNWE